jgi:glutamate transport system substrate-binding protein
LTAYHKTLGPWLKADLPQPQPLDVPDLVDFDDKAPTR